MPIQHTATALRRSSLSSPDLASPASTSTQPQTQWDAMRFVRDTFLAYTLASLEHTAPTSLAEAAARALDILDASKEEAIARHCHSIAPSNATLQDRVDAVALEGFGTAIEKRNALSAQIQVRSPDLNDCLRRLIGASSHIVSDETLNQAVPADLQLHLKRALAFIMVPGPHTEPLNHHAASVEQIQSAIDNMGTTWTRWSATLRAHLMAPIAAINQQRRTLSRATSQDLLQRIVSSPPGQLAQRLDAMDACSEDALLFAAREALKQSEPEHEGIPRADWETLHAHLDIRERAARAGNLCLTDLSQALEAARPDLNPALIKLTCALANSATMSHTLRAIASQRHLSNAPQNTTAPITIAIAQLLANDPPSELSRHLENSAEVFKSLKNTAPLALAFFSDLLDDAFAHRAQLRADPDNFRELVETRFIQSLKANTTAQSASDAADLLLIQLKNASSQGPRSWRDSLALLWANRSRVIGSALAIRAEKIEQQLARLGLDIAPSLQARLALAVLESPPSQALATDLFDHFRTLAPDAQRNVERALFQHNGKLTPIASQTLNTLRTGEVEDFRRLADLTERFSNRLRVHLVSTGGKAASSSADKRGTSADHDEATLQAAIASARAERMRNEDGRPGWSVDAEKQIDTFLSAPIKTGGVDKRQKEINKRLKQFSPTALSNLLIEISDREFARASDEMFARYKKRTGIEEWYLDQVLTTIDAWNDEAGERLNSGELWNAINAMLMTTPGHSNEPTEANSRRTHRLLMAIDKVCDITCAIHIAQGHPDGRAHATEAARAAAVELYRAQVKEISAVPIIGNAIANAWAYALDLLSSDLAGSRSLTELIAANTQINIRANMVFDQLYAQNGPSLEDALTSPDVRNAINMLARNYQAAIASDLRDSPSARALVIIARRLLSLPGGRG